MKVRSELENKEFLGIVSIYAVPGQNGSKPVRGSFDSWLSVMPIMEGNAWTGFTVDIETTSPKYVQQEFRVIGWKRVEPNFGDWKKVPWKTQA